ncbi:hypothetical protein D9M70_592110 [compost metagenome]
MAPGLDIGIEAAAAEHQVRQQGQVGHEEQRHRPGQGSLGGAHGQHRMHGGEHAEGMDRGDQVGEQMGDAEIQGHAGSCALKPGWWRICYPCSVAPTAVHSPSSESADGGIWPASDAPWPENLEFACYP